MERADIFDRWSIAAATALAVVQALGTASEATAQSAGSESRTCPEYVSREIYGPNAIQYSWGIIISKNRDSTQLSYTWAELARLGCGRDPKAADPRGRR